MAARLPDNQAERLAALHEHRRLNALSKEEFSDLTRLLAQIDSVPCVADTSAGNLPSPLTHQAIPAEQKETLRLLARRIVGHLTDAQQPAAQQKAAAMRKRQSGDWTQLAVEAERLRLAAIVETCEDAIYSMTLNGAITSWNRGAERLYGYTKEEVTGRHVHLLRPTDCGDDIASILDAVRRCEILAPLETVRLTKGGARVDVSLRVSPVLGASGRVVGASVIARDITERKRTEKALEAEREFTNALLESLREGIVACDAQGTLTLFNRAAREFHGLPQQPLPPEAWAERFDLYKADGQTPMRTQDIPLHRALQGEAVLDAEMVIAPKSGIARTLLASGRAIHGSGGERLGAVVAMHDVTERRQIERELSRLAALVESSEEAIIAGGLDGVITIWNRGAERLYGYTASEMIGRHSSLLAQDQEKHLGPEIVARLMRGEAVEPLEAFRVRKDGSTVDVSLSFSPVRDTAGQMIGVSCLSRDITDRKRAEETLAETHAALVQSHAALARSHEALAGSEARLSEAQRIAQIGNWDYDLETGHITWSEELFRLFGVDPANGDPDYTTAVSLYHPEDSPTLDSLVARAAREGIGYALDLRGRPEASPDGHPKWYHTTGTAVTDNTGRVIRLFGTLADITARKRAEEALRERAERLHRSEAALRAVLESAPVILYAADADGTITLCEGTGLAALGLKPGEAVGRSVFDFGGGSLEIEAYTRRALAGEALSHDARYKGLCLHTELRPMRGADGSPAGMISVCFDVTERVASEERFRVLFEHSSDAHLLFGEDGIIDCNPAAAALLQCSDKAQVLALHPASLSPEWQPDGRRSMEKCLEMDALARERGFHRFEWVHRKMNGEEFPVEVTLTPVTLEGRSVLLVVWHDLTERKQAEERIRDYGVVLEEKMAELEAANARLAALATTDGLTGLLNHRTLQERLAEEVASATRYGTPLSLILLDVDEFKRYNDDHGHPAGDTVLKEVARILQGSARDNDLAARYGGEEFVLVLPQTSLEGAAAFAERLRRSIEACPWPVRAVTASLGVAALCLTDSSGSEMVARADAAMYLAKTDGRNRVSVSTVDHFRPGKSQ